MVGRHRKAFITNGCVYFSFLVGIVHRFVQHYVYIHVLNQIVVNTIYLKQITLLAMSRLSETMQGRLSIHLIAQNRITIMCNILFFSVLTIIIFII